MKSESGSFKLFLVFLIVAGFVLIAAHQHRYDYFGYGRKGLGSSGHSIKDYFVDGATRKQQQQMISSASSTRKESSISNATTKRSRVSETSASNKNNATIKGDDLGRDDRKELGNLLEQVAP